MAAHTDVADNGTGLGSNFEAIRIPRKQQIVYSGHCDGGIHNIAAEELTAVWPDLFGDCKFIHKGKPFTALIFVFFAIHCLVVS